MKMKGAHFKLLILGLLLPIFANAQVGIGTILPNGKLTIDASAETTAALELVPQATPTTNLANGQLAVIGDKLYMYDATRTKWLTLESTAIQFGRDGNVGDVNLLLGGNMDSDTSGALMPFNGTIVAITAMAASGGNQPINVRARDASNVDSVDETFTLASLRYNDTTTNLDFDAGDYITVRVFGGNSNRPVDVTTTVWVKWRQ